MYDISALGITAGNFLVLLLPAIIILYLTGFSIGEITQDPEVSLSVLYVMIGTGIAMIIFNKLIQISDPVFSTSVTYTIPIVGLGWGVLDGEIFSKYQLISAFVILLGVFLVNRPKR